MQLFPKLFEIMHISIEFIVKLTEISHLILEFVLKLP